MVPMDGSWGEMWVWMPVGFGDGKGGLGGC